MPPTPILGRGYGAPPQIPPRRSGASRLRASLGVFGTSIVPPRTRNPGRTHPLKILATPMLWCLESTVGLSRSLVPCSML